MNEHTRNYIEELSEHRFWGFLTLKFEHGRIVDLRREENLKPNELLPARNRTYDANNRQR